ncbi:MAG TPA: PH domain-containing protein, partial [Aggregatilineales bacterium]|nr:PH domain-containing protein [Aggregatilineales bacterium]
PQAPKPSTPKQQPKTVPTLDNYQRSTTPQPITTAIPRINTPQPTPIQNTTPAPEKLVAEFEGQRNNETVLLKTRRHWWAFIQKGWFPALLFGVALMVWAFVPIAFIQIIACGFLGLFVPAVLMLYHFVEWRNDMLIITNQRVIHIERNLLRFSNSKSEIVLARIHQVNIEINPKDPMARLFRYGTVELRTAGDSGNIYLHTIPNVDDVQEVIFENRAKIADTGINSDRDQIRA